MTPTETIHASCVAFDGRAVLVTGASGSGKSALALALIARGGLLVADDRVVLTAREGKLFATSPVAISGLIEARGVGLLRAPVSGSAEVVCLVDLEQPEPERLPPRRKITLSGIEVNLVFGKNVPNLADALPLLIRNGRHA